MKMDGLSADFIPFSKRPARFPPNGEEGGGGMKRSIILIVNEHSFSSSKLLSYVYVFMYTFRFCHAYRRVFLLFLPLFLYIFATNFIRSR